MHHSPDDTSEPATRPGWLSAGAGAGRKVLAALQRHPALVAAFVLLLVLTGGIEALLGRSFFGPDRSFGWWEGNIWSSECSQRFADPYSVTHVVHGMLFYGVLWLVARGLPVRYRFLAAVLLEAGWEVLENSPFIINRYRQVTIALGYDGDSVLNSLSDILMMSAGFLLAARWRPWTTVAAVVAMEIGCLWWVRDNLTLNIVMLLWPVEAIRTWQTAGRPL